MTYSAIADEEKACIKSRLISSFREPVPQVRLNFTVILINVKKAEKSKLRKSKSFGFLSQTTNVVSQKNFLPL